MPSNSPLPPSSSLPTPLPTLWLSPFPPGPLPPLDPTRPQATGAVGHVPPTNLWMALNNDFRWRMVLRMAAGEEITAPQAAKGSGLRMSTVRKHLGQLRALGVVESKAGPDRRSELFYLPEARRPEPGVLDFGSCRIVLAEMPGRVG